MIIPSYYSVGEEKTMATVFWPNIFKNLYRISNSYPEFRDMIGALESVLRVLLALISFSILPGWKVWQASALLRVIPSFLMLIGFAISSDYTIALFERNFPESIIHLCISLNFLTTAIALWLFKNESLDVPHAV